jgi:hypothetical protein
MKRTANPRLFIAFCDENAFMVSFPDYINKLMLLHECPQKKRSQT